MGKRTGYLVAAGVLLSSALWPAGAQPAPAWVQGSEYLLLPAEGSGIMMTQDPVRLEEGLVPKRSDPKLLVLIYHNLVFGRTGHPSNRDIHNFESDLAFLRRRFEVIGLAELEAFKAGGARPERDAALITFDDGDLSIYAIAFPLLRHFGFKATFFIVPEFVGEVGYLSWEQVREMADYRDPARGALFSFGSHTLTHASLGELPPVEVFHQLQASKRAIEARTGQPVYALALPYGSGAGKAVIVDAAQEIGYRVIRSSRAEARTIAKVDLLHLGAFNVDSSNSDLVVGKLLALTGR